MTEQIPTPLTTRNIREALFYLSNQKMTVEELRHMLYEIEDQDAPLELGFSMWSKLEYKLALEAEAAKELLNTK